MIEKIQKLFSPENPLILASKSPQRRRIFEMMGIAFRVVHSEFQEIIAPHLSPEKNAERFALGKAAEVSARFPDSVVVGVDTLVVSDEGVILGKPDGEDHAKEMFLNKSGKKELIISGIAIIAGKKRNVSHETSHVHFSKISKEDAQFLVNLHEWEGKSGAIAVEGKCSVYIDRIEGNFWNIVGFPVPTFFRMMEDFL